jgi:predicted RNase H-like HicB family nuclease
MRTYTIVVEPDQDGGYFVTVPALPGCFTRAARSSGAGSGP